MCATGLVPTPDENPHSRSLRALEWGTLVKIVKLNGGLPGPPAANPGTLSDLNTPEFFVEFDGC